MSRHVGDAGAILASTVTAAAALAFVPVAAHFDFFSLLVQTGPIANVEALVRASDERRNNEEKRTSPLCYRLAQDAMFAMAGLGFVDIVDSETDTYRTNHVTDHIVAVPSAIHGMIHFTTEPLFAAPFLMRKLVDTNFEYPFRMNEAPFQYGHELLGKHEYVGQNFYSILHAQGRLPSFDIFMEGKFGKFGTMPQRIKGFGYDLGTILDSTDSVIKYVDVGGGRGEMLSEIKQAFPHLTKENLVLQEYQPDVPETAEFTVMNWDIQSESPQLIHGAVVYSLAHIYHNMPDIEALVLMQKMAKAMAPHSRMLIHEFSKNSNYGKMNSTMVVQFGGRIRSSQDWHQMASLCGLKVTFEAYPEIGEGLVEMMKVS